MGAAQKVWTGTAWVTPSAAATGWGFPRTLAHVLANSQGGVGTANRGIYQRVLGSGTITKIGLEVTANGGTGNISVAVYTGVAGRANPGARKATSGAVATPATSTYSEISLGGSVQVDEGDWFFLSCDSTSPLFRSQHNSYIGQTGIQLGSAAYQNSAHPAPSGTPTVTDSIAVPAIWLVGVA